SLSCILSLALPDVLPSGRVVMDEVVMDAVVMDKVVIEGVIDVVNEVVVME
ncbi:hypothetical protein Tco_0594644, partial [Tanacetum coccineum]